MRSTPWRFLFALATIGVAVVGWSTLLYPPVEFYLSKPQTGFGGLLVELLKPSNAIFPDGYGVGWIFLASSLALAIAVPLAGLQLLSAALRYIEASEATISVLESKFTLHFEDEAMSKSILTREQVFHANRPAVSSLPYTHSVNSPDGEIVSGSFKISSFIKDKKLTSHVMEDFSPNRIEAIEVLSRNLPTSLLATYLPDWLVLAIFNHTALLDGVIVERHGEIKHVNEFNGERARLEFRTDKFATRNMTVTISLPLSASHCVSDLTCFIIHRHAVSEIHPRSTVQGDRRLICLFIDRLSQEVLRIQWTPPRSAGEKRDSAVEAKPSEEPSKADSWRARLARMLPWKPSRPGKARPVKASAR
jgi:hypothetical protein